MHKCKSLLAVLIIGWSTALSACSNGSNSGCQENLHRAAQLIKQESFGADLDRQERTTFRKRMAGILEGCETSDAVYEIPNMGDLDLNHMYVITNDLEVLEERLNISRLDPEHYTSGRDPLLHWASLWADAATVKYLISIGFDPEGGEDLEGDPPLFHAASHIYDDPSIIVTLIDAGADPEMRGRADGNLLATALISDNSRIAIALIEYGLCPEEEAIGGQSGIELALEYGLEDVVSKMKRRASEVCK